MNRISDRIIDVIPEDTKAIISLCEAIGLFKPYELQELNRMLSAYFALSLDGCHKWLAYHVDSQLIGIAYYAEETFAYGVFNLLLIGIHPDYQRQGRGTELLHHVEQELRQQNKRMLIIETSGLENFAATRAFYKQNGYDEESCIREFYNPGEDKITFRKLLNT